MIGLIFLKYENESFVFMTCKTIVTWKYFFSKYCINAKLDWESILSHELDEEEIKFLCGRIQMI